MNRQSTSLVATLGILAATSAVAAGNEPLRFDAQSFGGPNSSAPAQLWRPAGAGPFPAVLVLHGCGGIWDNQRSWASRLASWGYAAIVLDSFRPRNVKSTCNLGGNPVPRLRAQDAFNAAIYLRTLPDILPDRIAVIGFSHGGSTALFTALASEVPADRGGRPFQAVVAYYPGCATPVAQTKFATDSLILIGKNDDWSSAERCEKMVAALAGAPHAPAIKVYPGALHDFDAGGLPHFNKDHLTGGNPEAAADSFALTQAFLAARLKAN
jgi:dienelactone hydrolase